MDLGIGIDAEQFATLASSLAGPDPIAFCACDPAGTVCFGDPAAGGDDATRSLAVGEALRFGEPVVVPTPGEGFAWAVPLTHNDRLLGGVVAGIGEAAVFPQGLEQPAVDVRTACHRLLRAATECSLCNAQLLRARRELHQGERRRAEAIHELKSGSGGGGNATTFDEAALVTAVRAGDRGRARDIINRRLVAVYHQSDAAGELTKSRLLELVVVLSRAAAESGGKVDELLGSNYRHLLALQELRSEEELASWLRESLERIMNSIERHRLEPSDVLLRDALAYLEVNCCDETIGRDEVARRAGLSPARFSRLLKERLGRGFSDQLNHLRISRAKQLLEHSDMSLLHIAFETGFKDPSYFTKVFRRHVGITPKDYRSYNRGR